MSTSPSSSREPLAGKGRRHLAQVSARRPAAEPSRDAAPASGWEVIAGASHDLRTPISSIGLMIDAIDDGLVDESTTRRYYAQIRKQLRSMIALADELILVSQLDSHELAESRQILDVNEMILDAVDTMAPMADEHEVQLTTDVSVAIRPISADADRLQRVLLNLIANAIRHTPRRETVLITAAARRGVLRLEVCDSGPGVAAHEREEVFEPFACGTTGALPGHVGLGLAISRTIVESHGGRIWLGPSQRGARFCIEIPAAGHTEP